MVLPNSGGRWIRTSSVLTERLRGIGTLHAQRPIIGSATRYVATGMAMIG